MKKLILNLFICIFSLLLLGGCALSKKPTNGYFVSQISKNTKLKKSEAIIIANDFSNFISDYYLPAKTKFYINTKEANSTFFQTINNKLRLKGYGLTFNNEVKDVNYLSWNISNLAPDIIRATYNIDTSRITKLYKRTNDDLRAYGSYSAINLRQKIEVPKIEKIEVIKTEVIKKASSTNFKSVEVIANIQIKEKPSQMAKVIGKLKKGEKVNIINVDKYNWAKLADRNGYISNTYIKH